MLSLGKRWLWGHTITVSKYIKGFHVQEGNTFLLHMGMRTKCCQLKLQQGRFRIDIQGRFLSVRMVKCWNRFFRDSKDSPLLRIFLKKNALGKLLYRKLLVELILH